MTQGAVIPVPYPDELLYSVITRYHLRTNNESPKWTFREIFGTENVIPTIDLPSHLEALAIRSETYGMTADDWIDRHTFFPYYAPFLPNNRKNRLRALMKGSDGSGIHALVGITASQIDRINRLRFCPLCYEQDVQQYGEPYWHRTHQLPGVLICLSHMYILHEITAPLAERHGLTILPISRAMFQSAPVSHPLPEKQITELQSIADDIQTLINMDEPLDMYDSRRVFLSKLVEKGFVTAGQNIRQRQLEEQFILYYGQELLNLLQSNPENSNYSWLSITTRRARRAVHPLRQVLLIRFLYGSLCELSDSTGSNTDVKPFGTGPWPCLNHASNHYREPIVLKCFITRCSDTGRPVGTFTCSCGFVYSRRGPDRIEEDKFHRGRIKLFGSVWADKLKQCMQEGLSYRAAAKVLGVDTNTVIKYATKGVVTPLENKSFKLSRVKKKPVATVSRSTPSRRVDWERRDLELSWEVEEVCKSILSDRKSKPTRISVSLIGKRVGKLSWFEKHADKLPVSMSVLANYLESVSDFQIRRVRWAADQMSGEWPLKRWKLERLAGLRPNYSQEVSEEIDRCINYNMSFVLSTEGATSWLHVH